MQTTIKAIATAKKALKAEEFLGRLRLLVIVANTVLYGTMLRTPEVNEALCITLIATSLIYAIYVVTQEPFRHHHLLTTSRILAAVDSAFILLWIAATGGVHSPFCLMLYCLIIPISYRFRPRDVLVAACAYALAYAVLAASQGYLVGPHVQEVLVNVVCIFFLAAVGTSLSFFTQREAIQAVHLEHVARVRAEADAKRAAFMAEVSVSLARSPDYLETLQALATVAVPAFADWCIIDMISAEGSVDRAVQAAATPELRAIVAALIERPYPSLLASFPSALAMRERRGLLYHHLDDAALGRLALDEEHLEALRRTGLRSAVVVPLVTRGQTLGALTFGRCRQTLFEDSDLAIATDIAERAALAVDNARLYRDAQEASRIKDEFLAVTSHELRTPMAAILGWADMLHEEGTGDPVFVRECVEIIARNARAQARLIDDILDSSRIITGKLRIHRRPLDVRQVVEESVESILPVATAKGLAITCRREGCDVTIEGDATRLQQVLWNLLANAVKFTPAGGLVDVTVRGSDTSCTVEVRDTGVGIHPEFMPFIFERFRQADATTTRSYGGLGLGLSIAHYFVELHGGSMRARSEGRGKGSVFTVELPARARSVEPSLIDPSSMQSDATL